MIERNNCLLKNNILPKISQVILKLQYWLDKNNNQMINQYQILQLLGRGEYGKVYKAKLNNEFFALKIYSLKQLYNSRYVGEKEYSSNQQLLQLQMEITSIFNHTNIVKCYQILKNKDEIITVNQLGDLGDLMNWSEITQSFSRNQNILKYICSKYKVKSLTDLMQIIFKQISQGLAYLHNNNITHRDIKPANIIARKTLDQNDEIKIIDFNTSRIHYINDLSYYPAGTSGFRAPQHQFGLAQGYSSKAADIWSLGITMYVFYHECIPFNGQTQLQTDIQAKNNKLQFSQQCPEFLMDIIKKMTQKNWKQRISIDQVVKLINKWDKQ